MLPAFWKVPRMRKPRQLLGRHGVHDACSVRRGKQPIPDPSRAGWQRRPAVEVAGNSVINTKPTAVIPIPPVAKVRAPKRSDSQPEIGPKPMKRASSALYRCRPRAAYLVRKPMQREPDALQPDDQHELQATSSERAEEAAQIARREHAYLEQLQMEERIGARARSNRTRPAVRRRTRGRRSPRDLSSPRRCCRRAQCHRSRRPAAQSGRRGR